MSKYTLTVSFDTPEELAAYIGAKTGSVAAPSADKPASTEKPKAEKSPANDKKAPPKPKHSRDEMEAALTELKNAKGIDAAKEVISKTGGVKLKADIPDDKIDAVYDAAKAAAEAGAAESEDEGM